ncbi:MAG: LysR family transcriptional regulator [Burkholderiales bacterium]|nr:LysR family transcriptional regulator [Burkholderiales bacterium]
MNLRQIEVFRAVMVAGSVTRAAELLHVSQPGISRMLGHIELQLGITLFERSRNRLRPTPEAEALYAEVEQVYRGVGRIAERAAELKEGTHLALRVLASPSTGLEAVPRALARLAAAMPAVSVHFEVQPAREMIQQLLHRECDVAISTLPIDHPLLASSLIGRWTLAAVLPTRHALAARRSLRPAELLGQSLVGFSADTPQGRAIAEWSAQAGHVPHTRLTVRSGQAACALVAASGSDIAVVDNLTARAAGATGLVVRPIARAPSFDIAAVTHAGFAPSAAATRFVALARQALKAPRA